VQPVGATLEAPAEPSGALVEATNQHQEVVGHRVQLRGETDDGTVEIVDGGSNFVGDDEGGMSSSERHRGT
jgi:hypothetical protein